MLKFDQKLIDNVYSRKDGNPYQILNVRKEYDYELKTDQDGFVPLLNVRKPNAVTDYQDYILQMALLARCVYEDGGGADQLPEPWALMSRTSDNIASGYFGASYYYCEGEKLAIVIAHRGTSSLKDLWQDFRLYKKWSLTQAVDANKFTNQTLKYAYDVYKKFDPETSQYEDMDAFCARVGVIHVGHSLGAALAELSTITTMGYAYTFENPGTKELFVNLIDEMTVPKNVKVDIKNYIFNVFAPDRMYCVLSYINFINTCNTQTGYTVRVVDKPFNFGLIPESYLKDPFNIPAYPANLYYYKYSLSQHHMDPLIDYIRKNGRLIMDSSPVGIDNGYFEYLNPDRNTVYWRDYFRTCWQYGQDNPRYKPKEKTFDEFLYRGTQVLIKMRKDYYRNNLKAPVPVKPLVSQKGIFGNKPLEFIFPQEIVEQKSEGYDSLPPYMQPSAPEYDDIQCDPPLSAEDYDYTDLILHSAMPLCFFQEPNKFSLDHVPFDEREEYIKNKISELQREITIWQINASMLKKQQRQEGCSIM